MEPQGTSKTVWFELPVAREKARASGWRAPTTTPCANRASPTEPGEVHRRAPACTGSILTVMAREGRAGRVPPRHGPFGLVHPSQRSCRCGGNLPDNGPPRGLFVRHCGVRTLQAALAVVVTVLMAGCSNGSDAAAARTAASQAAQDRAAVEVLASQAAADRVAAEEQLAEARAATSAAAATPEASQAPKPVAPAVAERPVAVGQGRPDCNGRCTIERRLTRSFLPKYSGGQTLLLASGQEPDDRGNMLHAFLIDGEGAVLWEEHGFGWEWQPVDERFGIRWDEAGHVFFRSYLADFTYLYVLDTSTSSPRLVGSPEGRAADGFQLGEVIERPGQTYDVRETLIDCPEGEDVNVLECPDHDVVYRWNGHEYVSA